MKLKELTFNDTITICKANLDDGCTECPLFDVTSKQCFNVVRNEYNRMCKKEIDYERSDTI